MKKTVQIIIGVGLGVGLLWLVFRGTNWNEVLQAIAAADPVWLAVFLALILLSFVVRVQRWSYIVRTAKPVSFRHLFSATQIGFLANFTLPGRIGEVVRAIALTRLAKLPFTKSFAMVILDRITDLFGLLAVVIVTVFAYTPEGSISIPASTLGVPIEFSARNVYRGEILAIVSLVVLVSFFVLLYVKQELMLRVSDRLCSRFSQKLADKIHLWLQHFADGLHIFRSASDMAKSIGFSLLVWSIALLALTSVVRAFDVHVPWQGIFVIQLLLAVFISAPGAPGFVGQFHAPIVIGLVMFVPGIEDSKAKAIAIMAHLLNLIPVAVVGLICLFMEKLGLVELARESAHTDAQIETEETSPAIK
ncbi:MAG TPA: lysylphosphatidylglycerol synthase transmembrane domain-containing protein [Candidatus Bathyarchaeia archaeon]|nr:lysylphosphatidylglycerol synthase transmembrane domain-containing protein [Candidatus Bathyarchaeia archaeon]